MADKIVINYPMVERMARTMSEGAKKLESSVAEMNKVVSALEHGGLRGDAGSAFAEAVRGGLIPSMQRLRAKFEELQQDLNKAKQDMETADKTAANAHRSG